MLCWVPSGGVTGGSPAPAVAGPSPRSGHTLTTLAGGETHVLFGGAGRGAGSKASYLCDAHIARVTPANGGVTWQALATTGDAPPPRARHTAVALDERRLLVWGGTDQKQQFNDCWVLDVQTASWKAVEVAGTAPQPRAHHTACRLGDRLFVFGGYGGSGTALGDLWVLHLGPEVLRWEEVAAGGAAPQPRFDHAAAIFPCTANSSTPDRLIILGGRDSSQNFSDMHVLDLESMSWLQDHGMPPLGGEVSALRRCTAQQHIKTPVLAALLLARVLLGLRCAC
jgi:dynein heavy chain